MGAVPTTTNQTATAINNFVANLKAALEPVIQTALIAADPTLGVIVIKQVTGEIESIIENYAAKLIEECATFIVIDAQVGSEKGKVSDDVAAILADEKSGNQEALTKDEAQYQTDTSSLDHDDGSAPPPN